MCIYLYMYIYLHTAYQNPKHLNEPLKEPLKEPFFWRPPPRRCGSGLPPWPSPAGASPRCNIRGLPKSLE